MIVMKRFFITMLIMSAALIVGTMIAFVFRGTFGFAPPSATLTQLVAAALFLTVLSFFIDGED